MLSRMTLLAITLSGCVSVARAPPKLTNIAHDCKTKCGLYASEGSCRALQETETAWLKLFSNVVPRWEQPVMCAALDGWRVTIRHDYTMDDAVTCGKYVGHAWLMGENYCVIGYTHVEERMIELPDTDYRKNSLMHEMVHVVDFSTLGHEGHCSWTQRHIYSALKTLTGESQLVQRCDL